MGQLNRMAIRATIHEAGEYANGDTAVLLEICRMLLDEIESLEEKLERCE